MNRMALLAILAASFLFPLSPGGVVWRNVAFVAVCRTGRGVCRIDRPAWADGAFHAGGRHYAGCGCSCLAFGVCLSLFRRSGGVVVRPYVPVLPYASGDISRLSVARELFRRYYALLSCPSHASFQLDAQRRDVGRRLGGDAGEAILMHEKAHVLYGHSYDTLLMLLWRPYSGSIQWFG